MGEEEVGALSVHNSAFKVTSFVATTITKLCTPKEVVNSHVFCFLSDMKQEIQRLMRSERTSLQHKSHAPRTNTCLNFILFKETRDDSIQTPPRSMESSYD